MLFPLDIFCKAVENGVVLEEGEGDLRVFEEAAFIKELDVSFELEGAPSDFFEDPAVEERVKSNQFAYHVFFAEEAVGPRYLPCLIEEGMVESLHTLWSIHFKYALSR